MSSRQLSDWLEHYMAFTQNTEPPLLYHLWSGLTAISTTLRRKCYTNWGSNKYLYPNLYVCLVGPPGGRKGTAMKIIKPMLAGIKKADGKPISLGSESLGSIQALYQEIIESKDVFKDSKGTTKEHKSLSVWSDEFQVYLSDRDPTFMAVLTDLFDCADNWKYRTVSRKIEDVSHCFLTIIGAITPSLLQAKLTSDAIGGGLVSRIIFVVGYGPAKRIALPFYTEQELEWQKKLQHDLQRIANLTGPFKLPNEYLNIYAKWYNNTTTDDGVNSEKFVGYNSRRSMHLNKISMLVSAAESDDMILLPHHFEKALAILEITETEMGNAFQGYGGGSHAGALATILMWIEHQDKFSFTQICNKFYLEALPNEMSIFMEVAVQRGLVTKTKAPTDVWYEVQTKKVSGKGDEYLNETVLRLMIGNLK